MKRLKALIKMELPPALIMGIYFMVINIIAFATIQMDISHMWKRYLSYGITAYIAYYDCGSFTSSFMDAIGGVTVFYGIGLCLLSLLSFMKDKNHETGRFLKALPYTMKERNLVKMGIGLSCFFVNFIVLAVGMFILRAEILHKFNEVYEVLSMGELMKQSMSSSFLAKVLIQCLMICVAVFVMLTLMQYLINNNIASVISSIFIFLAPGFIVLSAQVYTNLVHNSLAVSIGGFVADMYIGPRRTQYIYLDGNPNMDYSFTSYNQVGDISCYVIFWTMVIIVGMMGILLCCSRNRIENSDLFINNSVFRWIYIVGATLCGGLLVGDFREIFFGTETGGEVIVMVIGMAVSFVIVNKIAHIGCSKRSRGVKA